MVDDCPADAAQSENNTVATRHASRMGYLLDGALWGIFKFFYIAVYTDCGVGINAPRPTGPYGKCRSKELPVKGKFLQSQPKGVFGSSELFRQKSWWQSSCFVICMRRPQTPQS